MDGNNFKLNIWDEAKQDIKKLDGSQLVFVKKGLKRIEKLGITCGQPLHEKLEEYRKLKNRKMGLRIVFDQNPKTKNIEIIDIIAIGHQRRSEVYDIALSRINNQ